MQIRECALFIALISANTNARSEGYFRLEWKLAVDRSHLKADDQTFLLPVLVDELSESAARVPDRFRERQWLRFVSSETPAAMVARVCQLLHDYPAQSSSYSTLVAHSAVTPALAVPESGMDGTGTSQISKPPAARKRATGGLVVIAAGVFLVGGSTIFWIFHAIASKPINTLGVQSASNPLSLAILPLRNATGDPKLMYIAEGLTASLSSTVTSNLTMSEDAFITPPAPIKSGKTKNLKPKCT